MNPADQWPADCGDGCGNFFGACLRQANLDLPEWAHVLEIGCAEFDWLKLAARSWPTMRFWGIDWRAYDPKRERIAVTKGDARQQYHYAPNSFDWIVSVSAMEHMGLGHYDHDPKDDDGDTVVMTNAFNWLRPGGYLLFDVPWQPQGYEVCGTSHRVYDPDSLFLRLWCEPLTRAKSTAKWCGQWWVSAHQTSALVEKPTERINGFYYTGCLWQKLS